MMSGLSLRLLALTAVAVAVSTLAGCGANHDELQQWMEQQRREVKPNVPTLSAPKKFDPQPYASAQAVEPFSNQKLSVAVKADQRELSPLMRAELARRKEPLEAFPLDSMAMVGSVFKGGQTYALLRVDRLLYQVKLGEHLGQNAGQIKKITETEITLMEKVLDAGGELIERPNSLQLQERAR